MSDAFINYEYECAQRALDRGDEKAYEELMANIIKVEETMFWNALEDIGYSSVA